MSASVDLIKYYFCASNESIYSLMERGIWHNMPLNESYEPIAPSTITLVRNDGSEVNATDVKVNKYVRLITDPRGHLSAYKGNIASVFIVEVSPKIIARPDVLKICRIKDKAFEHLKMMMVDPGEIVKIHVYSREVERKLRESTFGKEFSIPIVVTPVLFQSSSTGKQEGEKPSYDFEIMVPQPSAAAFSNPLPASKGSITIVKGDLLRSNMQTLVNTVNCVGVMGKGIALAFKRQFPAMFSDYKRRCQQKQVALGKPYSYCYSGTRIIINFPTKGHWKANSNAADVEEGLKFLVANYKKWGITSMAIPPLGCGNGNLEWDDILPLMRKYLEQMDIPVEIYAPHEANAFSVQGAKRTLPKDAKPRSQNPKPRRIS